MSTARRLAIWPLIQWSLLTLGSIIAVVPILLTFMSSFKSDQDFFNNTYSLPSIWLFSNYASAWNDASMGQYFVNSVVVTGGGVLVNVALCAPLAYALARFRFRLNGVIYMLIVGGLI